MNSYKKLVLAAVFIFCLFTVTGAQAAVVHDVDCINGPNNTIQQAINVAADGDIIVVHPCLAAIGYPAFTVTGFTDLQIVGADLPSFIVSGFQIGPNSSPPPASGQIESLNPQQPCAVIEASTNVSLVGLLFTGCNGPGIELRNSRAIKLHGNRLFNIANEGVLVRDSQHVDIVGNQIQGATDAIFIEAPAMFVQVEANRLQFNVNGIRMEGEAIDVVNNEVRSNADEGIIIDSTRSKVSRNWVAGNGATQIAFNNFQLADDNCVVGNWMNNGGQLPPAGTNGCQAENN